jgi:hypothetical protein
LRDAKKPVCREKGCIGGAAAASGPRETDVENGLAGLSSEF